MLQNKNNNPITHVFHVVAMICLSVCLQPIQAESIHIGGKFSANEIIPLDHLRNNPAIFRYMASAYLIREIKD